MRREYGSDSNAEVLLNRAALALAGLGLLLLLLKIASTALIRFKGGSFGDGFLDSSADGYRFIVYVGLIITGGLVYSLGIIGRALSEVVVAIILWQIGAWYLNYQSFSAVTSFWQGLDVAVFGLVFAIACVLFLYLPYNLITSLNHRLKSPNAAR